ncbi:MAG: response regulator [Burkholderiales bacterium]
MRGKLLIVEDQPDIRKLIRMTLEFEGYDLLEAENGAEGLHIAQAARPVIVLLDVMMPGELDGYQVCERIKQDPSLKGTRVIMLTARGQQTDLDQGRKAGCDAYLTKPFSPLELIDTIDRLAPVASLA